MRLFVELMHLRGEGTRKCYAGIAEPSTRQLERDRRQARKTFEGQMRDLEKTLKNAASEGMPRRGSSPERR